MSALKTTLFKGLATAGLLSGLVAAQAAALPQYKINPNAIPGAVFATSPFTADAVSVANSSELLTLSAPAGSPSGTASGSGWAQFGSFSLNGTPISPLTSGLLVDYGLYLTFDLSVSLLTGSLGLPGSTYQVTQLDFKLYADPGLDTAFTQADASPVAVPASVGGTTSDDILLAFGSLLTGVADLNALGGAGINATNTFAVCTGSGTADFGGVSVPPGGTPFMQATAPSCPNGIGNAFFDEPNPFYQFVFSTFNNTSQGVELNGTSLAINAAGRVDFVNVPEPASLALVGLALAGLGLAGFRRKAS